MAIKSDRLGTPPVEESLQAFASMILTIAQPSRKIVETLYLRPPATAQIVMDVSLLHPVPTGNQIRTY